MTKAELLARLTEVKAEINALDTQYAGQYMDPAGADGRKWNEINAEHDQLVQTINQVEARENRVREVAANGSDAATPNGVDFHSRRPGAVSGQDIYDLSTVRSSAADPRAHSVELLDRAKRAIEAGKFPHSAANREDTQGRIEALLESVHDPEASFARRILISGKPAYKEAFGRWIATGGTQFSADMQLGTDANGGFIIPFELDPTIINTSSGSVNPYRQIARVVQITGKEWDGVKTAGVTAAYGAESSEAADGSFTLAQPTVRTNRASVFVPASYEITMSWSGISTDLAELIQSAKDDLEASKFTTGSGTAPNPEGILTGATIIVNTASTAVFASGDLDKTEEALPARFQPNAQWLGNRKQYNLIRHFDSAGGPNLWLRVAEGIKHGGNTGLTLNGYPANECSSMSNGVTSATKILTLGDFSKFIIVDRIGMNMEVIPNLIGANQRPTGQRGFFAYWMNGSKTLALEAFRTLALL